MSQIVALNPHEAPQATVEALMYSLRRGVYELAKPDALRRLRCLNESQVREVAERVGKFKPHIAPAWDANEVEALLRIWSKRDGK